MNTEGNCKCFHHSLNRVLAVLAWISALGFWWATAFKQSIFWVDGNHFFMDVVILTALIFVSKACGCCGSGSGMCSHGGDCKCGDCNMCK